MYLQHDGQMVLGDSLLDTDLRDLAIVERSSGTYLYATTGRNGGLVSWRLADNSVPVEVDRVYFPDSVAGAVRGIAECLETESGLQLVLGDAAGGALLGYRLEEDGSVASVVQTTLDGLSVSPVQAVQSVETPTGSVIYVVDGQSGQLSVHEAGGGGNAATVIHGAGHLATVTVDGQAYLLATDLEDHGVVSLRISGETGALSLTGSLGSTQGLGVNAPAAMEVVQAFGTTWVLLGASGSHSISLMELDAQGNLIPRDHLVDTLETRFGGVQSLAVAQTGDRVFVIAGGDDDGLSLFTLLPDGRLLHLQSLPHSIGAGLMNVGQISATVMGDAIQIFVTGSDAGIARLSIPLEELGVVLRESGAGSARLEGGAGCDLIVGADGGHDTLIGGGGDDILVAGRADTTMTGGAGADRFVLREGAFTTRITDFNVAGGDQIDMSDFLMLRNVGQLTITTTSWGARITFRDAVIEVFASGGGPLGVMDLFGAGFGWPDRVLVLPEPGRTVTGTTGNDHLEGGSGADTISGGAGHDTLWGGSGNDLLWGGDGGDLLFGGDDDDSIHSGDGDDEAWGGAGNDTVRGGDGNDTIGGGPSGDDLLLGGEGDDQAWAGNGDDTLWAGAGDDTLGGGAGNDLLWGEAGNDEVWGAWGHDTLHGGTGADMMGGADGNDLIFGDAGNDTIGGGDGDDTLNGGEDDDLLWGRSGRDRLEGGVGLDTLYGGEGADTLLGGGGEDSLLGDSGHDRIDGGDGNDTAWGGAGNDTMLGGSSLDFLGGADDHDSLSGGAGMDTLIGGGGNDVLSGDAGRDFLRGDVGNDTLSGGNEADTLLGGEGDDRLWGGAGNDLCAGDGGNDRLNGGTGHDTLAGGSGQDTLEGGDGEDEGWGGAGNDILSGGGGDDTLGGGSGHDTLSGGDGSDVLRGGGGDDMLTGGSGADTFVFYLNQGTNRITDFTSGTDQILIYGTSLSFDDLTISGAGNDTVILVGSTRVILEGVITSALDVDDFLFV